MALTLYTFALSHFAEKGRSLLAFKKLEFRSVELKLGWPQLGLLRMSGQRKVPVLDHDGVIVPDSTEIALYLERTFAGPPRLLPDDEGLRRDVLELEDRVDRVLGGAAPLIWFNSLQTDPVLASRVIELEVFGVRPRSSRWLSRLTARGVELAPFQARVARAERAARRMLDELCDRLAATRYLVGDEPSLADVAAAALALHLRFPKAFRVSEFAGLSVPGWGDDPRLSRFFEWRDRFYEENLA